jgi:ATP/maltotriose-dependent transcriptional regulator MalT
LTDRETQILQMVAEGMANAAIAKALFITEATVKTHLIHIYAKLAVKDRAAAVATAYTSGLL